MGLPQIILLVLFGINLLAAANLHGEEAYDHNFWEALITNGLVMALLIWGGFFNG